MHPEKAPSRTRARARTRSLSVREVLELPVLAEGLPRVLAGASRLDRAVRWVHVTELLNPADFLEGGELLLTTGMPYPEDASRLSGYVDQLADVGAAGLVVELGYRYRRVPRNSSPLARPASCR